MEYLAFKSLEVGREDDILISPVMGTPWERRQVFGVTTYYLSTPPIDIERGNGIFAAAPWEALKYKNAHILPRVKLFLVAPFYDKRGKIEIVLGDGGWRASAAIVVTEVKSLKEAARMIIAAHNQGYRQVEIILKWAYFVCPEYLDSDACPFSMLDIAAIITTDDFFGNATNSFVKIYDDFMRMFVKHSREVLSNRAAHSPEYVEQVITIWGELLINKRRNRHLMMKLEERYKISSVIEKLLEVCFEQTRTNEIEATIKSPIAHIIISKFGSELLLLREINKPLYKQILHSFPYSVDYLNTKHLLNILEKEINDNEYDLVSDFVLSTADTRKIEKMAMFLIEKGAMPTDVAMVLVRNPFTPRKVVDLLKSTLAIEDRYNDLRIMLTESEQPGG